MSCPTKLTKELQEEICGYIENGNSYTTSIKLAGITEPTFYAWKKQGKEDEENEKDTIHSEFFKAIKIAREKFKAWNVQQIMNAAKDKRHWTAAAWLLERIFPDEFGKKERIEHSGKIDIEMTEEEIDREIEKIQSKMNE